MKCLSRLEAQHMNPKHELPDAIYERNYVYNFHYHLIWTTKYRHPVFTTTALVGEMKDILCSLAAQMEVAIEEMEVMEDHVHLLLSFKPKYAPTNIVKNPKSSSTRIFLHRHPEIKAAQFWGGYLWSHSYCMSTLGNMSKTTAEKYIRSQYCNKKGNSSPD